MNYNFDEDDLHAILEELDIKVDGETSTDFICFCPFHRNNDTPAFNISKESEGHPFRCWNAACGASGNILSLIDEVRGYTRLQTVRFLHSSGWKPTRNFQRRKEVVSYPVLAEEELSRYHPPDPDTLGYLYRRGFSEETARFFQVGTEDRAIVIPCRDESGSLVGFTRRMTYKSKYKYLDGGLPKRFLLFNINNAKGSDSVIVTEGPLDAMKISQSGFRNVVATMMGDLTDHQAQILQRNFKEVIIFTDQDETGHKIGVMITEKLKGIGIYWANIPEGYKDAGEMTESQIRKAIEEKQSTLAKTIQNRRQHR